MGRPLKQLDLEQWLSARCPPHPPGVLAASGDSVGSHRREEEGTVAPGTWAVEAWVLLSSLPGAGQPVTQTSTLESALFPRETGSWRKVRPGARTHIRSC